MHPRASTSRWAESSRPDSASRRGHRVEGDDLRQPRAVHPEWRSRHRARVVLDHRRSAQGGRPSRSLLRDRSVDARPRGGQGQVHRPRRHETGTRSAPSRDRRHSTTRRTSTAPDPIPLGTYSECVDQLKNGTVDVVTTDGAILLGYAAENPDELEVVGEPFSEERYGIGYKKGTPSSASTSRHHPGTRWTTAPGPRRSRATLGQSGNETPDPPEMDPCQ